MVWLRLSSRSWCGYLLAPGVQPDRMIHGIPPVAGRRRVHLMRA